MFTRFAGYVIAMVVLLLAFAGTAGAVTTGTADGTYDFGSVGVDNSGGAGFKTQGDKFKVSNALVADVNIYSAPTDMYVWDTNGQTSGATATIVIKAEGGATNKRFSLKDMNFSTSWYSASRSFDVFTLVVKDYTGSTIATHALPASSYLNTIPDTPAGAWLSTFAFANVFPAAGYDNVAEIHLTWHFDAGAVPGELNIASIKLANVSNTFPPPTVTTQAASALTTTLATGNGNITAVGGATATARGVVHYTYTNTDLAIGGAGVTNVTESGSFGTGAFTAALTGLAVNTQYNARAHASSIYGTGYGARVAFWTLANVPSAPTVSSATGTTLDVAVNANGNPAGTEFCIQETSTGNYVQASGALGGACVWQTAASWGTKTVTGLNSGTTYTFQIKARNGGSTETAYGATASGVPVVAPTTYGLSYDGNGQTSGSVPSDATAYASGASATVLGNTGNLVKTGYTFVGWNLASNGSGTHYAVGSSYTITSNTTLYAQWLGIVSATAASSVTHTSFTANWGSVAGATGYRLDVATDSGFGSFVSGHNNLDVGNATSWAVAGLAPGTSYFYRLRAYSASLTAADSNSISLTTQTGPVSGIVVDPAAPATLYTAVDGGGVFTSSNSGASWSATTGQPGSNRVQKLLLVAGSPTTLYAATYGSGIFFSINSGTSWSACTGQPANLNVLALTGDASGRLYAGTEGGVFTSTNSCSSWSPVNGGLTVDAAKPPLAIVVDPNSASTLYAGFDGDGVYKSSNSGTTWAPATTQPANLRVKALVIKPGDSSKLFAATYGGGMFQSTDSGVNWNLACASQPANLNLLSLVMDATGKLYAGSEAGVFVSTDGCASWSAINTGMP